MEVRATSECFVERHKYFVVAILLLIESVQIQGNPNITNSARWVPQANVEKSALELNEAGRKYSQYLYIGRVQYLDGVIPGKQLADERFLYFTYNGKELTHANDYELLVFPRRVLSWIEVVDGGNLPPNRFQGGTEPHTGKPLYICRVWYDVNDLVLGVVTDDNGTKSLCKYSWKEKEWPTEYYDLLVDNRYSASTDASNIKSCEAEIGIWRRLGYVVLGSIVTILASVLSAWIVVLRKRGG